MYLQNVSQISDFYSSEVLILSTKTAFVPVLTNAFGREDKDFNFEIDEEAEVYYSCSLTWQNELFVFGGKSKKNQISKVQSCRLAPIGQLAFEHSSGDCVNVAGKKVVLCFNDARDDRNKCRVASSPTGAFSKMKLSQYEHGKTRIATNDGEFFEQNLVMTFLLQNLLSLLEAGMTSKKLNYSMLKKTFGQMRTITRLIGD